MKQSTCYNCQERTSNCHTYCEKYKAFKAEKDAENAAIQKSRKRNGDMFGYSIQKYKRLKKMSRKD